MFEKLLLICFCMHSWTHWTESMIHECDHSKDDIPVLRRVHEKMIQRVKSPAKIPKRNPKESLSWKFIQTENNLNGKQNYSIMCKTVWTDSGKVNWNVQSCSIMTEMTKVAGSILHTFNVRTESDHWVIIQRLAQSTVQSHNKTRL